MNYRGWSNFSDDCSNSIKKMDDLFNSYDDEVILGGDGLKYIKDMVL